MVEEQQDEVVDTSGEAVGEAVGEAGGEAVGEAGGSEAGARNDGADGSEAGARNEGDAGDTDNEQAGHDRVFVPLDEKANRGVEVAGRILTLLGTRGATVESVVDDEQILLRIGDFEPGTGHHLDNRAVESLQFVLNKAVNRNADKRTRVNVEAPGFKGRRTDGLEKVASSVAQKVQQLRRPLTIGPMSANDLRTFGHQIGRQGGVEVKADEADDRRLVVSPAPGRSSRAKPRPGKAGRGRNRRRG